MLPQSVEKKDWSGLGGIVGDHNGVKRREQKIDKIKQYWKMKRRRCEEVDDICTRTDETNS